MDEMYEVLGPNRYVIHYMLHDGAVTRCGKFFGEQLVSSMPNPAEVFECSRCKTDKDRDVAAGVDST